MALEIKAIPTLHGAAAERFIKLIQLHFKVRLLFQQVYPPKKNAPGCGALGAMDMG